MFSYDYVYEIIISFWKDILSSLVQEKENIKDSNIYFSKNIYYEIKEKIAEENLKVVPCYISYLDIYVYQVQYMSIYEYSYIENIKNTKVTFIREVVEKGGD